MKRKSLDNLKNAGRYCDNGQVKIWYDYSGGGNGPVNVFIHGLGGTSQPFRKCKEYFEDQKKPTLLIDLRSHGFSEKPLQKKYEIDDFAQDILDILDKENIRKINLVGHCFGGMVAIKVFEKRPEAISSLVLLSTNYRPNKRIGVRVIKMFLRVLDFLAKFFLPNLYYNKKISEVDYGEFRIKADYYPPRLLEDYKNTSLETFFFTMQNMLDFNFEETIKKIDVPTKIFHGKRDSIFSYLHSKEMAKLIPKSELELLKKDNHVTYILDEKTDLPEKIYSFFYC